MNHSDNIISQTGEETGKQHTSCSAGNLGRKHYCGLVAFDLDHTLLDHQTWRIPHSALKAISMLRKKGYCIVIASGRDMLNKHAIGYYEQVAPDAVVHMNGTKVQAGNEILVDHEMDKQVLKRLLDYAQAQGHALGAHIEGIDYFTWPEAVTAHDMRYWGSSDRVFGDPCQLLKLPVKSLAYAGNAVGAAELREQFPELKVLMFSAETGADVFEKGFSKADGIRRLCEYFGIDLKDTYAFGDSHNDLEMLETVHCGIAMGNAVPDILAAADYVTDRIDEDGIWNACRHFGLI